MSQKQMYLLSELFLASDDYQDGAGNSWAREITALNGWELEGKFVPDKEMNVNLYPRLFLVCSCGQSTTIYRLVLMDGGGNLYPTAYTASTSVMNNPKYWLSNLKEGIEALFHELSVSNPDVADIARRYSDKVF